MPPRPAISTPTPEQVDPEFTGTPMEWTDKYGHVQIQTAEERATDRFGAWTQNIRSLARAAKECPDWPDVDLNWLRRPRPRDIAKMEEAMESLESKIAAARVQLNRAKQAVEKPRDQPAAGLLPTG